MFSEVSGRKLVSTETAESVGKIADFVVDPSLPGVVALTVAKSPNSGSTLPWANVRAIGPDAVTVASPEAIIVPDERITELADKSHTLVGKRVLSTAGVALGTLRDVDFDPTSGRLALLLLDSENVEGDRILGVGSYAVVVKS